MDLKNTLLDEMESHFREDTKRINHAKKVLSHAEKLLEKEHGADLNVVYAAAILHDIGIHEAERKHGSCAGRFQEIEGPPIARKIMKGVGMQEENIKEVCDIIAHHHTPGKINTLNFRILYDADWLVNIKDEYDIKDKEKIKKIFLTDAGEKLAKKIYLPQE